MVIVPYKYEGMWVFDDPAVGLTREPFIAGIDGMIDKLVAPIPDAQRGFRAIFSGGPFPGYDVKLEWRREESGGNWYYCPRFQMEGWLCPALLKYFPAAPREIYVKTEPREDSRQRVSPFVRRTHLGGACFGTSHSVHSFAMPADEKMRMCGSTSLRDDQPD